ncbi:unnamed protein product [Nippostrongylus brasiliensis]|uniref:Stomatin-like protein 1 (inferred by orthology to a human protein) n=1 Tax=Nippostrongylus brasiliensis TaxID=27835 RepID=A0A0N4XT78_NIPBR|nr:unnamed protein product [Nippostrongylus brasiliensis]
MTFPSVRYSTLRQDEQDEDQMEQKNRTEGSTFEYGMPEGSFDSAFTYANYNDLDRMGYQEPARFGNTLGNRYSGFTYSTFFEDEEKEVAPMSVIELLIYGFSVLFVVLTLPFSLLFVMKFVSTSERLVVLRLGRAQKTRGPGATFVLPCIDTTYKISTTITAFNVPPLQVITVDRGLVELGATVFLRIRDPVSAVCSIQGPAASLRVSTECCRPGRPSSVQSAFLCNEGMEPTVSLQEYEGSLPDLLRQLRERRIFLAQEPVPTKACLRSRSLDL